MAKKAKSATSTARYVSGNWNHIFGSCERDCRFVYDRQTEQVVHLEVMHGVQGWMVASAMERLDVEDSLKTANYDALTHPAAWSLEETDEPPIWSDASRSGVIGKHDWCVGKVCDSGYPVFVDDRQLSYRPSILEGREFAMDIIARLQADGDYRLNDKPAGFVPPPRTGLQQEGYPYLKQIDGGRSRVLVLHTKDTEATFVIPPGSEDRDVLLLEAENAKRQAAELFVQAKMLESRSRYAAIAAELCAKAKME